MKGITLDYVQKALAEENIVFDLVVSGSPMPYHLQVKLTAKNKVFPPDATDLCEVVPAEEHIIQSSTVLTHPNTLAEQLWNALKKHKLRVDVLGGGSIFYMVKHNKLQKVKPSAT